MNGQGSLNILYGGKGEDHFPLSLLGKHETRHLKDGQDILLLENLDYGNVTLCSICSNESEIYISNSKLAIMVGVNCREINANDFGRL